MEIGTNQSIDMKIQFLLSHDRSFRLGQKLIGGLALIGLYLLMPHYPNVLTSQAILSRDAMAGPHGAVGLEVPVSSQATIAASEALKANAETIQWIENKGQLPAGVLYSYSIPGSRVYVERDRLRFEFLYQSAEPRVRDDLADSTAARLQPDRNSNMASHSFVVYFDGANANPTIEPGDTFETTYNYFRGADPNTWARQVHAYKELLIKNLYPGISLRLYSQANRQLEYDWLLEPGADYRRVNLRIEGADDVAVAADGSLGIALRFGSVQFKIPESHQVTPAGPEPIAFTFARTADNHITFETSARIDPQYPLVIDPTLGWGTWFDGNSATFDGYLSATAVDSSTGYIYCAGYVNESVDTYISGVSTPGYDPHYGESLDAIIYVFSADGKTLKYATYYAAEPGSGTRDEHAYGLSLSTNRVFVAGEGYADGTGLPMAGSSFDGTFNGGQDGYVAVFSKDLSSLIYATYLGSAGTDSMYSVRALSDDSFVVSGIVGNALSTTTPNYLLNSAESTRSGIEGYIAKFGTLNTLTYGTYVGGTGTDTPNDIQIMSDGRVAFVGTTSSSSGWPSLVNSIGSTGTGTDGFIGTIPTGGSSFQYLDLIGGSGADRFNGMTLDGNILYWTGSTQSSSFPGVSGKYDTTYSGETGTPAGSSVAWGDMIIGKITVPASGTPSGYAATYFGATTAVSGGGTVGVVIGLQKPTCSNATYLMVFGSRMGANIPVKNINDEPFYEASWQGGGSNIPDMLIAVFSTDLTSLYFSTLAGGNQSDYFGQTGDPRGSGNLTVSGDKFILGTTSHSPGTTGLTGTFKPRLIGDSAGSQAAGSVFDPVRSNPPGGSTTIDAHLIFTVSFESDDYGDAPSSYGTGTAAHRLSCIETETATTLHLGSLLDAEGAGNPSNVSGALLDDSTGSADEDGVILPLGLDIYDSSYRTGTITVLNNTGQTATLYGWIDFNIDGKFDLSERQSTTIASGASLQTTALTWSGLSGLVAGQTYARFRLTTGSIAMLETPVRVHGLAAPLADDTLATGPATNGEIEDYTITIEDTPSALNLTTFKAVLQPARIKLSWRTGQELDLVGFNVWRQKGTGEWKKVTQDLIGAKNPGLAVGAKYNFKDKQIKAGKRYHYKLELVGTNGKSSWSDPIKVRVPKR